MENYCQFNTVVIQHKDRTYFCNPELIPRTCESSKMPGTTTKVEQDRQAAVHKLVAEDMLPVDRLVVEDRPIAAGRMVVEAADIQQVAAAVHPEETI